MDAVAVVVNKSNPLDEITIEQLKDIFSGKTDKWPSGDPVTAFNRNEDSGTRELFTERVMGGKDAKFGEKVTVKHDGVLLSSVAKIPNAIGYTSLGETNDTVKVLKVTGVEPTAETIQSGKYPLARTLTFATKGDASTDVAAFFTFIASDSGKKIVTDNHYVPLAAKKK
jgi:phosphate transport system substrate-binding protein